MDFNIIRNLVNSLKTITNPDEKKNTINKASGYVNSMDSQYKDILSASGINIFTSGEEFKNYMSSSTGVDDSIFAKSISEIEKMDLSSDTIEKQADSDGFSKAMNEIYSNDALGSVIDLNEDGKISDKEAKEFINTIKAMDSDVNNFSLDDIAKVIDELDLEKNLKNPLSDMLENFQKAFENVADNAIKAMDEAKGQGALNAPNAGSVSQNPYVQSSGGSQGSSASNSSQAQGTQNNSQTLEQKKQELETQIENYNKEITDINAKAQEEIEKIEQGIEKKIKEDKKLDDKAKEQYEKLSGDIQKKDEEISKTDSEISQTKQSQTTAENGLSSLKSALSSLKEPTGKEEDKDADAKLNQRKSELEGQIKDKEKEIEELKQKVTDLETKKETLATEKKELEQEREKIEKNTSKETQEAIKELKEKEKTVENDKVTKIKDVEDKLKTTQDELKKVEDEIQQKENKSAENQFDADFDEMLGYIFDSEGGFSNNPNDYGGATNYGITEGTYRSWTGDDNADVSKITKEEAAQIYYQNYYQASGAEEYAKGGNKAYAYAVFDAAVNHGVGAAAKMDAQAGGDVDKFMEVRKQKYINIVANDSSQQVFAKGWQNRWNTVYSHIDPNHQYESYTM